LPQDVEAGEDEEKIRFCARRERGTVRAVLALAAAGKTFALAQPRTVPDALDDARCSMNRPSVSPDYRDRAQKRCGGSIHGLSARASDGAAEHPPVATTPSNGTGFAGVQRLARRRSC
jgi:hypothetical protein